MKRKYDKRNKRNFVLILILSIFIIGIFSLFIYKYNKVSKISYKIEAGSVVQDVLKNYVEVTEDSVMKIRWNDKYYIEVNDEKIELGKKVMVYNTITGGLKLYGTFYEINEEGKVITYNNETVLANTTDSKFYKLDDREYLLVDSKIFSDDRQINASGYLFVELDKLGNAKLSNNQLNLKTISETKLVTSKYTFDINNETLTYDKKVINLKKVIGSTNEYKAEEEEEETSGGSGTGSGDGNGTGTGTGSGTGSGSGIGTGVGTGDVINNTDKGNTTSIEEVMDKVKMTSIIRYVEDMDKIDIDYVVYDPYTEYQSVYVEVIGNNKIETIYLNKNDTHITINNLAVNTEYKLNFVYTTSDKETGTLIPYTFETYEFKTLLPEYEISIYKISTVNGTMTYKVNMDENFNASKVNVSLTFYHNYLDEETGDTVKKVAKLTDSVTVTSNNGLVYGTFNIKDYDIDSNTSLVLSVDSVESGESKFDIDSKYSFRFGR